MKRIVFSGIFLLIFVIAFFSCKKDNIYVKARKEELKELEAFIAKNYPDFKPTASGLYFIETQKGNGDTIKVYDKVQIYYQTWLLQTSDTLVLIDASNEYLDGYYYEPYEVTVGSGGSISGLEEGLTYMQPGSKATLIINSELAYGQDGLYPIPGFSTLVMEVEVYKVFPYKNPN